MVEQILIEEGRKIVSALKEKGIALSFAVWYSDPSAQGTYLALGAKTFDEVGPGKAYEGILQTTKSIKSNLVYFRNDYIKLVSLESALGKTFASSFANKTGDTMIGMFVSSNYIFHQVYAYGI